MHAVTFQPSNATVAVPTGTLVSEALQQAGLEAMQPCGGQGRCGRCAVRVEGGTVRRRSTLRLSPEDVAAGYALSCQTVVEGDAVIVVPEQEAVERQLTTDRAASAFALPFAYDPIRDQTIQVVPLTLPQPTMTDSIDDVARLQRGLAANGFPSVDLPLPVLRTLGQHLRDAEWDVAAVLERDTWQRPDGPPRLIGLTNELTPARRGVAIDIGTTTVSVRLIDLDHGTMIDGASEYNGQIARGEDVISRIISAGRGENGAGLHDLHALVLGTINTLLGRLLQRQHLRGDDIVKAVVVANPTMIHLFLGLPPASIRLSPYVPVVNHPQPITAFEAGLHIHPLASVDCLPGVSAYVGADITAGTLAAGLNATDALTLFIDVGTNGEIVLGNREWLVSCACSAGPAFEGAGVVDGMRATRGAIEEVWVNSTTHEPTVRVIGDVPPRGICGSGLISLLAELFITGVMDRGGNFKLDLGSPRLRVGEHGPEYVVAWASETSTGRDIVLTKVDVDNLLRAKAAIYAGFTVLAQSVGLELDAVERFLIGGSFGQYINIEKAVQIGLLPDLPWERFEFLGNTAVKGAALALLSRDARVEVAAIASRMTYLELSADNTFYDAFTNALFLPHTDLTSFPSVVSVLEGRR